MLLVDRTDVDLLRKLLAGDSQAFTTLYRRRQSALYRFALQMSGSESVAEEVVQEVFLGLIRRSIHYDSARGSVLSFLFGVTRNLVFKHVQQSTRHETADEERDNQLAATDDPLMELTRQETIDSVRKAVLSLPVNYREAIVLCDLEELSYEEAASALGCAVGTVRSRLSRGRSLLIAKLSTRCLV